MPDFRSPNSRFWYFCLIYCAAWFFLPFFVQKNLRPDSIEQLFVAKEWVLSSTKHPALTAWFLEISLILTGRAEWATYLVSQIAVLTVLWCLWTLGKEYLPLPLAFLAVLAGCNYRYLNIGSTYFHHNISILPFWALSILFFYKAVKEERALFWGLAGLCLGLGMLCKYPMGFLAVAFTLFVAASPQARKQWKRFFLMTAVALLVFAPHFFWLIKHDFTTLRYASYVAKPQHIWDHLINPLRFLGGQAALLIPVVLSLVPLLGRRWKPEPGRWNFFPRKMETADPEEWKNPFLLYVVVIPVLLQLLVGIVGGGRMRTALGTHLWLFFPLFLLYVFQTTAMPKNLKMAFWYAIGIMLITMLCFVGHYQIDALIGKKPADIVFPGRQLAKEVEKVWHERYDRPIPYVAGEWRLGGNVAFYGQDRPSVHAFGTNTVFSSDKPITTWSSDEDLYAKGAVILWEIREGQNPEPPDLAQRFPRAVVQKSLEFPYRTRRQFPPLQVGLAFIPPPNK
ncbi:MAG: glycosyltransferase family 39 protein [Planctomycetaceae bacterium]|nr:glycosyltransferase family 39 protein [Planctomycetaceae bacterium]